MENYVRIRTEDLIKIVEERDRLRKQVTELQEKCNAQLEELRQRRVSLA